MVNKKISRLTRSLLRYPGSKARLAGFIGQTISMNKLSSSVFIEPFCGGASISIALLESDNVTETVLNDIDPIVAALWKCVFSRKDANWLSDIVMKVPLSLDQWHYQKNLKPRNLREAALKCLYLNRTSFSGILNDNAGPIGGRSQDKWNVGCRFNREKLATRILQLSQLSDRVITVTAKPWKNVCDDWKEKKNTFLYLDPPFYNKARRLYRFTFTDNEHKQLRSYLIKLKIPWVLSYDNAREIRTIYDNKGLNARIIDNTYSAHPIGGNSFIGREVVYSNLKYIPVPRDSRLDHVGLSIRNLKNEKEDESNRLKFIQPLNNIISRTSIGNTTSML